MGTLATSSCKDTCESLAEKVQEAHTEVEIAQPHCLRSFGRTIASAFCEWQDAVAYKEHKWEYSGLKLQYEVACKK